MKPSNSKIKRRNFYLYSTKYKLNFYESPILIIIGILIVFFVFSCKKDLQVSKNISSIIDKNPSRKSEILKTLNHYNQNKFDSLKMAASIYLIERMADYQGLEMDDEVHQVLTNTITYFKDNLTNETVQSKNLTNQTKVFLNKALDSLFSIKTIENRIVKKKDISNITSEFIIDNIECAFMAYNLNPKKNCITNDCFFNYILPYRAGAEPLETGYRRKLFNEYKWALDSLKTMSVDSVVKLIYNEVNLSAVWGQEDKLAAPMPLSVINEIKIGDCSDISNLIVSILRSIGIPSGIDYTLKFANRYQSAPHTWVFYYNEYGFQSLNVGFEYETNKELYSKSSIPKIWRRCFGLPDSDLDVTDFYKETSDITIPIIQDQEDLVPFLGVFDTKHKWFTVDSGEFSAKDAKKQAYFKKIGRNIVYLPFFKLNNKILPFNNPFFLDNNGLVNYFIPDENQLISGVITRKYVPYWERTHKRKLRWVNSMNGSQLFYKRNDSNKFDCGLTISGHNTTHSRTVKFENYLYSNDFVFEGPKNSELHIAQLEFIFDDSKFDFKSYMIDTVIVSDGINIDEIKYLTDRNPLTYIQTKSLSIQIKLIEEKKLLALKVQSRNDDNHINQNQEYELFYWKEKNWKSLGKKIANDTILIYPNIPSNSLLMVKRTNGGVEESVFRIDISNNTQDWFLN